jgi:hypothetical protein
VRVYFAYLFSARGKTGFKPSSLFFLLLLPYFCVSLSNKKYTQFTHNTHTHTPHTREREKKKRAIIIASVSVLIITSMMKSARASSRPSSLSSSSSSFLSSSKITKKVAFSFFFFFSSSFSGGKALQEKGAPRVRTKYDVDYSPEQKDGGGWLTGRATYFDASFEWKTKYFSHHEFGYLETNGCGYTSKRYEKVEPKSLPFAVSRSAVAALADFEMKSSCGQCYEVKCDDKETKIRKSFRNPNDFIAYNDNFTRFEQNKNARDSYGRSIRNTTFPPAEQCFDEGGGTKLCEKTTCYDRNKTIFVQIIDICPCDYIYGRQEICCGDIPHFDLSFWAFELLAHPIQGKMNLLFRPVDCVTKELLDAREGALAHVRKKKNGRDGEYYYVYDGKTPVGFAPGWRFRTYYDLSSDPAVEGKGKSGGFGACSEFDSTGTMAAACLGCESNILPFSINGDSTVISLQIQIIDDDIGEHCEDLSFLSIRLEKRQDRDATREYSETPCAKSITLMRENKDESVNITQSDDDDGSCVVVVPVHMFECKRASVNANTIVLAYDNPNTRKEVCLGEVKLF